MLRLWLSLAIEYEGEPPIDPLPNLDFKIVRGDSLLGPDPGQMSFNRVAIEQSRLGALKADYLRASDGVAKDRLRADIEAARELVRTDLAGATVPAGVVDWSLEFAEVFASRGGFDIAIANPPYVRMEQISNHKTTLKSLYPDVYRGTADYYVYFYNRAIQSLCGGGVLVFISSNKYMRAGYGKKLRAYLSSRLVLSQVVDFGDLPLFTATAYPSVVVGRKLQADPDLPLRVADLVMPIRRKIATEDQTVTTETVNRVIESLPSLLSDHAVSGYPRSMLAEEGWVLEDLSLVRLFERLMNTGTPLGDFVEGRIYVGIKTGLNEAFVVTQSKRDELVATDPGSVEVMKPWVRGRDIRRWRPGSVDQWLLNIPWHFPQRADAVKGVSTHSEALFKEQYPAVYEHLSSHKSKLSARNRAEVGVRYEWYSLSRWGAKYQSEFDRPKILWPDIARELRFAYDDEAIYPDMTCFMMPSESTWLLAVLNSELTEFLLCLLTSSLRGGFLRPKRQYITRLPIVTPDGGLQRELEAVAEAGIAGEPIDDDTLNDLVYDLYGLSRADRALIQEWFERRSLTH